MRRFEHTRLVAVAALAFGVGLGGAVIAVGSDDQAQPPAKAPATGSLDALKAELPVFVEARDAADAVPPVLEVGLGGAGKYPNLSRKALTVGPGAIYLLPTATGVCVAYVENDVASPNCGTVEQIQAGDTLWGTVNLGCSFNGEGAAVCGEQLLYGVAAGQSRTARARLENGDSVAGRVARNAYAVKLDPAAQVVDVALGK